VRSPACKKGSFWAEVSFFLTTRQSRWQRPESILERQREMALPEEQCHFSFDRFFRLTVAIEISLQKRY